MTVKLLTEHEFLRTKGSCKGLSENLHLSKYHIVGNHMSWLIYPSFVLVQPRKTRPCVIEKLLMGRKESNQTSFIQASRNRRCLSVPYLNFKKDLIRNKNFITIYILAIQGELNVKILLLRFFICWAYNLNVSPPAY